MTRDPQQLHDDIVWLTEWADDCLAARKYRGHRSYGGGASDALDEADNGDDEDNYAAHAEVKTRHHEKMAALHAKISDLHASMSARYARAAHTEDGDERDDEDHGHRERKDVGAVDEARIQKLLQSAALDGDLATREQVALLARDAVRACLRHPQVGDPATAERGGSR